MQEVFFLLDILIDSNRMNQQVDRGALFHMNLKIAETKISVIHMQKKVLDP